MTNKECEARVQQVLKLLDELPRLCKAAPAKIEMEEVSLEGERYLETVKEECKDLYNAARWLLPVLGAAWDECRRELVREYMNDGCHDPEAAALKEMTMRLEQIMSRQDVAEMMKE